VLQHIVFLHFKTGVNAEQKAALSAAFAKLESDLDMIYSYRWGEDLGLNAKNADYVLLATFANQSDFERYANHPEHIAMMKASILPLVDRFHTAQIALDD